MKIEFLQVFLISMASSPTSLHASSYFVFPSFKLLFFTMKKMSFNHTYFLQPKSNLNIISDTLACLKHYMPKTCATKRCINLQWCIRYNMCQYKKKSVQVYAFVIDICYDLVCETIFNQEKVHLPI